MCKKFLNFLFNIENRATSFSPFEIMFGRKSTFYLLDKNDLLPGEITL
jgi:hypothetical protein